MSNETTEYATVAGGCFWCMVAPFEALDGVLEVTSGYMGGTTDKPTYNDICSGLTGHAEVVHIRFDANRVSFEKILEVFWQQIDPTSLNRQFADAGTQYRTAIFYHGEDQQRIAEQSKQALADSGKFDDPIVTEITAATTFYPAEDYHQGYHAKNPVRYQQYRHGSGRARFLEKTWGEGEQD